MQLSLKIKLIILSINLVLIFNKSISKVNNVNVFIFCGKCGKKIFANLFTF